MRPVQLEMTGFGSFRDRTVVDFTDADFFVLVGATGAGKSTIIDAITFALYGSVHRWDDARIVNYALAPTATIASVKLVFDVGAHRYVAARQVRRGTTNYPHHARLERLRDPAGLPEADKVDTVSLAGDPVAVRGYVEALLGLTFDEFCTCVLLPQGDFAAFLHASGRDRQRILEKLLDAEKYRQVAQEANQRAARARAQVELLTASLADYVDATPTAVTAAAARADQLDGLDGELTATLVPAVRSAADAAQAAQTAHRDLLAQVELLTAVEIPAGAADLDGKVAAADKAHAAAGQTVLGAEAADSAARAARAAGPNRSQLEQVRRTRNELAAVTAQQPAAQDRVAAAATLAEQAGHAVRQAVGVADRARDVGEVATRDAATASAELTEQQARFDRLSAVTVPPGVPGLDGRLARAERAADAAERELGVADGAETAARDAADAEPHRSVLVRQIDLRDQLTAVVTQQRTRELAEHSARDALAGAGGRLDSAQAARRHTAARLDGIRTAEQAAVLRAHLVPGQRCPVCDSLVDHIPAAHSVPELADAEAADRAAADQVDAARAAVDAARTGAARAETAHAAIRARLSELVEELRATARGLAGEPQDPSAGGAQLDGPPGLDGLSELDGLPDQDGLHRAVEHRDLLDAAAKQTLLAARAARGTRDRTAAAVRALAGELTGAWGQLRQVRDPLVADGAPAVDELGLAQAWDRLAGWASTAARRVAAETATLRRTQQAAAVERTRAAAAFDAATQALDHARDQLTAATAEQAAAVTAVAALDEREKDLAATLDGAPDAAAVEARLAFAGELEQAETEAGQRLSEARGIRDAAARDVAALDQAHTEAAADLTAARDRLVVLGAPVLPPGQLLGGWAALVTWSADQASRRGAQATAAAKKAASAWTRTIRAAAALTRAASKAGVTLDPAGPSAPGAAADELADWSPGPWLTAVSTAVAGARAHAHAAHDRLVEHAAVADRLRTDRAAAREDAEVAGQLANLLAANRFISWLTMAALDALLVDASANLMQLSDGQFELAHDGGALQVIDHADADTRRVVKTLSGGETFQASLSLALALSSQLAARSMGNANRLDSIFLDEGFGTLDEQTLDAVAGTLENLAHRDRMVGIITHVPALADRIPVRYRVTRNSRTSSVVREDL